MVTKKNCSSYTDVVFLSEEPALAGKCVLLIFSAIPSTQCLSQQICIMHICAQCSVPSAVQVDFFLSAL